MMIVINHTLADEYIRTDIKSLSLTSMQHFRINIVTSLGSITMLFQFIGMASIIVRKDKRSIADVFANVRMVYMNKYTEEIKAKKKEINVEDLLKPRVYEKEKIDWV